MSSENLLRIDKKLVANLEQVKKGKLLNVTWEERGPSKDLLKPHVRLSLCRPVRAEEIKFGVGLCLLSNLPLVDNSQEKNRIPMDRKKRVRTCGRSRCSGS